MINKENKKRRGVWFTLETNRIDLPGILEIDYLELQQTLKVYSDIDFDGIKLNISNTNFREYATIYGEINGHIKITLFNCVWLGNSRISNDLWELKFRPEYSLLGALIDPSRSLINEVTCQYQYFTSWFQPNRDHFKLENDLRYEITINSPKLIQSVALNDTTNIDIIEYYIDNEAQTTQIGFDAIQSLTFRSSIPLKFSKFQSLIYQFSNLMQVAIGEIINVDITGASLDENTLIEKSFTFKKFLDEEIPFVDITHFSSRSNSTNIDNDYINKSFMLFHGESKFKISLKHIIKNWYNNYEQYRSVYSNYLDIFPTVSGANSNFSLLMFRNRILNLIQALEKYHELRFPEFEYDKRQSEHQRLKHLLEMVTNDDDRMWILSKCSIHSSLRSRLIDLFKRKNERLSKLIFSNSKQIESFVNKIKLFRDSMSHGSIPTIPEEQVLHIYEVSRLFAVSCIMETLGFSEEEIYKRLTTIFPYKSRIEKLRFYYDDKLKRDTQE